MSWFRDNFALELAGEAEKRGLGSYGIEDILTEQASKIEPGSEGLVIIPTGCRRSRPHGKGMMLGFTAKHTRAIFSGPDRRHRHAAENERRYHDG